MSTSTPEFYEKKTSTILRNLESIWNKLLHSSLVLSADLSAESLQDFEDTMNSGIYSSDDYQLIGNFVRNLCRPNKNEFIEYICRVKMQYLSLLTNGSMIPRLIWFVDKETKKRRPLQDVLAVDYDHGRGKFVIRRGGSRSNTTSESFDEGRRGINHESNSEKSYQSTESKPANNRERKMERREQREIHNRDQRNHRNETNESRLESEKHNDDYGYVKVGRNNRPVSSNPKYRERQDNRYENRRDFRSENRNDFRDENRNDFRSENRNDFRSENRNDFRDENRNDFRSENRTKSYNPQNPNNDPHWKYNKNKLRNEQRALDRNSSRDFKRGEKDVSEAHPDKSETTKQKIEPLSNDVAENIIKELSNKSPTKKEAEKTPTDDNKSIDIDLEPVDAPFQPMEKMSKDIQFYIDRTSKNLHVIHPDWVNNPEKHPLFEYFRWKTNEEYQKFLDTPCSTLEEVVKKSLGCDLKSKEKSNKSESNKSDSNKSSSEETQSPIKKSWADYE